MKRMKRKIGIRLGSKIIVSDLPSDLKSLIVNKLRFPNPVFIAARSAGRSTWGVKEHLTTFEVDKHGNFLLPRGIRTWLESMCDELDIEYTLVDERTIKDFVSVNSATVNLRPYQSEAVTHLISTAPEGVLVSPAGSGKTIMGLSLLPILGQPTLWLTHTNPLMKQTTERALGMFSDIGQIGVIGDSKWKIGDMLTIAMIQTLVRNPARASEIKNEFGMVIVDECHRSPSRTFTEVIGMFNPYYLYGLTATPYRRDKLDQLIFTALGEDKTVIDIDTVKDYGSIMIPKILYKAVYSKKYDDNDIHNILRTLSENMKRNHIIVGDVVREALAGNYCIVISDRRSHCEALFNLISMAWPKTGIATGNYSKKYVTDQVERFNNKEITVLVTTASLLGEGFDVPFLNRGFITMPFRGRTKTVQIVGRIQRSHPSKTDAVIYDYVDVNIGVIKNQFYSQHGECRFNTYKKLGAIVEPYS